MNNPEPLNILDTNILTGDIPPILLQTLVVNNNPIVLYHTRQDVLYIDFLLLVNNPELLLHLFLDELFPELFRLVAPSHHQVEQVSHQLVLGFGRD